MRRDGRGSVSRQGNSAVGGPASADAVAWWHQVRSEAQRDDECRLRRHGAYEFCRSKRCSPAASRAWDAPRRELLWKQELGTLLASAMCEACRSSTPSTQRGSASRFLFPVALLSPVACRLSTLKSHTSSSSPSRQPILDSRLALHPQLGRGQRAKLRASLTASPSASPP